jgi:hypothetical protein
MATKDDNSKRIRRLEDNPAGRVVTGTIANRWEWSPIADDETSRLLRALQNDELRIEDSKIARKPRASRKRNESDVALDLARRRARDQSGGRDAGGGFNPYDHSGKPRRR